MKQYLLNNKLYNCELLTENMESGELWYFLRAVDDSTDVIKWRKSEMPDEYVPKLETFKEGHLVYKNGFGYRVLREDKQVDINISQMAYVTDRDGNYITNGNTYRSSDGHVFKLNNGNIVKQINMYSTECENATKIESDSISFITGKPINDLVWFNWRGDRLPANREECVQSTISGDFYPSNELEGYLEDGDEIILRSDVGNYTNDYFICDDCGSIVHYDEHNDIEGNDVCDLCRENNYTWSDVQQAYIDNDEVVFVNDEVMSEDFRNEHYVQCEDCGEWFDLDETGTRSDDGYPLCDDCYPGYEYEDGSVYFRDCGFIQEYHPDIEFRFYGDTNATKFMGCEWEVQGGGENGNKAKAIFGNTHEFYCCHDGSLSSGFEAITHPCTPSHLLNAIPWKELASKLEDKGYDDDWGAGFHIHISRDHFKSQSHIGKLIRFFYENYMKLVDFGNRPLEKAQHWANATDCSRHTSFKESYEQTRGHRYSAINVNPYETIEIRLFNTSYDYEVIKSYIQFADIITDLANGVYANMTFENVKKEAVERGYSELVEYMAEKNLA